MSVTKDTSVHDNVSPSRSCSYFASLLPLASRAMVIVPKAHTNARALVSSVHPAEVLKSLAFRHAPALHGRKGAQDGDALTVEKTGLSMDLVSPRGPKDLFGEDLFENWLVRT